ncbi:DNA (cytosine-5-)-methyltransferase [[Haemophilus] felis]|nr:DNA (cytosine-5-)-methyltransferase [[Haemophilus] felis]
MKYSNLRNDLKIEELDPLSQAYITHYIHNYNMNISKLYEPEAKYYLDKRNIQLSFPLEWDVPFPAPQKEEFTFIDLFAGIGGFRIALQNIGGKCLFSSEFNSYAQKSYELNFGELPFGDINDVSLDLIPEHDVLCAGFPCQPFSISGKMRGFEDTRGTLIYRVFEIIQAKQPKVVFLENVKHLVYHDNKRTLLTIIRHLEELGYLVSFRVLNATDFGLPQNRERIIIIASKNKKFDFKKIFFSHKKESLKDFLDEENNFEFLDEPYTILSEQKQQKSGLIFAGYRNKAIRKVGVREGTENLSRVHKQPNRIYSTEGVHPALPSQETSGRFWIFHDNKVRKLTIQECYRIMGFPDNFILIDNKSELYKQVGNSVAIPMIQAVGKQIKDQLLGSKDE